VVLYILIAQYEGRPITVWPFGVFALLIGGYLTVRFSFQREEIMRRARQEVEERQRLQMFIGMVAHDLAGGMTNVLAGVEMLRRHSGRNVSETERVAVAAIEGGSRQMRRLLDDLRDASAIGAGRFGVRLATMDLTELARQVVDRQRFEAPRHRLTLDAPNQLAGDWDRERIAQLLTNLISNAVKYSPDGGEVRVTIRAADGDVTIGVRDHGIGIEPRDCRLIFEPFARVGEHGDLPGTGLGLWIAKAIVEAHGGRIWVESEIGAGSTFTTVLPVASVRGDPTGSHPVTPETQRGPRATEAAVAPRPSRVVLGTGSTRARKLDIYSPRAG
jgi:signal transduction histidine kinase